jgi:tetratricopeptide (TPR) repeat protein
MSETRRKGPLISLFHGDPFERMVVVLITSVALLAAIVTLLQTDASSRADRAERDGQRYAIQAMGRRIVGGAKVDYGWYAYQVWDEIDVQRLLADRADDTAAAARYRSLRSRIASLSPFLAPPYFDPEGSNEPDLAHYEADTYYVDATALSERYTVAAALNNAWTDKANTYVTHLTLLAVSLFLYGLATTVAGWTRWLFVGVGSVIAALALLWIILVTLHPVPTLADRAIDAYAQGVGFSHQGELDKAVAAYDQAVKEAPGYANAYYERGNTRYDLGDFEGAVADYVTAQKTGRDDINVAWNLGWTYYLLGRFGEAIDMDYHAVGLDPHQIGARFNLALAYLADGQIERARGEYADSMNLATKLVTDAEEEGKEPPSSLWTYMDAGARDLQSLVDRLNDQPHSWTEAPPREKVAEPDKVQAVAQELVKQLKSLTTALEHTGKPPAVQVAATISPIEFALITYDDKGNEIGKTVATSFPYGTDKVLALFDYEGMQDGEEVLWKLYHDGFEDPSWRFIEKWSLGKSGSAQKPFSLQYTNLYQFTPGEFTIEMYVDNQLLQQGSFVIENSQP